MEPKNVDDIITLLIGESLRATQIVLVTILLILAIIHFTRIMLAYKKLKDLNKCDNETDETKKEKEIIQKQIKKLHSTTIITVIIIIIVALFFASGMISIIIPPHHDNYFINNVVIQ